MAEIRPKKRHFGRTLSNEEPHLELRLSTTEARQGVAMQIELPAKDYCPSCGGVGRIHHWLCSTCRSYGWVIRAERFTLSIAARQVSGNAVQLDLHELDLLYRRLAIHVRVLY